MGIFHTFSVDPKLWLAPKRVMHVNKLIVTTSLCGTTKDAASVQIEHSNIYTPSYVERDNFDMTGPNHVLLRTEIEEINTMHSMLTLDPNALDNCAFSASQVLMVSASSR